MAENGFGDMLKWEARFNTEVHRIDFEHKIFLMLINSFKRALDENHSRDQLIRILNEIEKYAGFHFISEENLMLAIDYPDYREHRNQHFDLLEQFNLAKHETSGLASFYNFIKEWFINHTVLEDIKIKEFIVENNLNLEKLYYDIGL